MTGIPGRSAWIILCTALATQAAAQDAPRPSATLLLRVVDSATRQGLPNAEVTAAGGRGLTDARGEVRIRWPSPGTLHVRVRQLGFRYVERDLRRDAASVAEEDTAVVALARLRWALPQMVVRAEQKCRESVDAGEVALSQASMELLRFGAEQFDNFRRAYPFDLTTERRTTLGAARKPIVQRDSTASSEWGDRYVPGKVIQRTGPSNYFVPLLFVSALADSAFWDRHCFVARGVESRDGRRLIRLDFTPALGVRDAEWEGSAWLDSARSVLARVDFRLTNLREVEGPEQFEGYTIFSTPTPFIAMPDSTVARWLVVARQSYGYPSRISGVQSLVIRDVRYRRDEPPK